MGGQSVFKAILVDSDSNKSSKVVEIKYKAHTLTSFSNGSALNAQNKCYLMVKNYPDPFVHRAQDVGKEVHSMLCYDSKEETVTTVKRLWAKSLS